jgi:Cu(I)/Ag(I) efflux system membrane protein CusA/SilA
VIQSAVGGENVTTTVAGRQRYGVNVRCLRDFRSDFSALERIAAPMIGGIFTSSLLELMVTRPSTRSGN